MVRTLILRTAFAVVVGALLYAILRTGWEGVLVPAMIIAGIAVGFHLVSRRHTPDDVMLSDDAIARRTQTTDVINLSSIRVAGIGGLGFVAVAIGIAIALPRIGQTLIVGAIGGAAAAYAVIRYRRTHGGPLDSSHMQPGGRAMLVEPEQPESADRSVTDAFGPHPRARVSAS
jgi:hypothetical protein